MAKPVLTSKTRTESRLVQYASNVVKKSKENADLFPEATEKVTLLETALADYTDSLSEAAFRDMRQVVIKNQQAVLVRQLLYDLSLHVESVAKGDPNIVLAAGFVPGKNNAPSAGISPKANDLRAVVTHPGTNTVQLRVNPWRQARFYQFEYRKAGSMNEWTTVLSTKSKLGISDLDYLQEYEFRVTYLGTIPTPNYSDTVRCVVV
ncbi:hypothetical protein FXV77_17370 [Sphingobacterium phlebotomi]|uniref:Fibronectin type-III domain-containing protein n=1 Tax=Sphingobacterium phlebotomi TaxID=2605433 RepID=A0A5D4H2A7_9SPHI|nr:hypothetical protein [Sphingobacterium phlebotomi]TYR33635.1 hypothetical protein FXV77_17370 [Sphingobacterium phlebotomi]